VGLSIDFAGGCLTMTMQGRAEHECQGTSRSQAAQALVSSLPPAVQPILQRFITSPPDIGIVTSEVNGSWYVSPTRTYLQEINAVLAELQPNDIQTIIANASGIGQGFMQYAQKEAGQQLGLSGLGPSGLGPSGLGGFNAGASPNAMAGAPSVQTAAAISNAINAETRHLTGWYQSF
jgi:hypothetical protein